MERVERIYSSYSGVYDLLFDAILHPGRKRAVEAMAVTQGQHVLEVGVGTGLSLPLYPEECRVTAVDISRAMLRRAQERADDPRQGCRADIDLRQMSAERLQLPDRAFDRVLLSYLISCVDRPDQVVSEVHRVCAPEGRVLFLNHFGARGRILPAVERALTPLSRRLGFVLDMPLDVITRTGLFRIERIERVNVARLWTLAVCAPLPRG
ncbi:MAG: class I SAM-dependent methyltransferase [Candidatus Polarisedimenticolia bacterium]